MQAPICHGCIGGWVTLVINNVEQIVKKEDLYYCTKKKYYKKLSKNNILPIFCQKENKKTIWVYIKNPKINIILGKAVV